MNDPRLSEGARALLRRFDRQHALPPGMELRVARRLHATLREDEDEVRVAARGRGMPIAVALVAVAAGLLAWWVWPGRGMRLADGSNAPVSATDRAAATDEVRGVAVPRAPSTAPPVIAPAPIVTPAVENVAEPERSGPVAVARTRRALAEAPVTPPIDTTPEPSASTSLGEEMALLARAQSALRSGHPEEALQHLRDHARSYPDSSVGQERAALRVLALCAAGRTTEAARERTAFLERHADSPLRARVREACTEEVP